MGADLDWRILHGRTPGGRARKADDDDGREGTQTPQLRVEDNFHHYGLRKPELLCADQSRSMWARAEVFDAIVSDPPYGVRAGARKSGRKGEVRPVGSGCEGAHIPPSQQYDVEDVVDDLLDMAARTLKVGGRLVYLLPTTTESVEALHSSDLWADRAALMPSFSVCAAAAAAAAAAGSPTLSCRSSRV